MCVVFFLLGNIINLISVSRTSQVTIKSFTYNFIFFSMLVLEDEQTCDLLKIIFTRDQRMVINK